MAKIRRNSGVAPYFPCIAAILPLFNIVNRTIRTGLDALPLLGGVFFAAKGIHTMRKIILAAAIATSALGLAACSEKAETETVEATDAMAADAEAAGDAVADSAEGAADATTDGVEAAADNAADAAAETADAIGDKAEEIADDAEAAAE
jgi:hypothetical protein